jgi:hypothetical protein
MGLSRWRVMQSSTAASAIVCAFLLASCGGSAPKPDPAKEARLAADANALCREASARGKRSFDLEQVQPRLLHLAHAIEKAAAYLPVTRKLEEAEASRRRLVSALHKLRLSDRGHGIEWEFSHGRALKASLGPDFLGRLYSAEVAIHEDWKALGITACLGPPPRAPIGGS